MVSGRLVTVTLARAWDAGERMEQAGHVELALALDAQGRPDVQAWLDDPAPWPAARIVPGQPAQTGDVGHDEEGWVLRFFAGGAASADVPPYRIVDSSGPLRPGEILTLRAPDGAEAAWRVVNVSARAP